ncbi:MAG: zf-HC2 domain-containing protein [Anaerolineales bacterium]|uniref:anti-sigma factor family protein n=1 Tax=Candidatus Villigracilis vicinus TaxID=3140679 RepID=UPI003135844C|nr:zf-HC2 domain-containing protein [Anaerolineales bacterium]MBK7451792.1 zf-HC2 domain-containing protein [Anaerolineales bacterium]
MTSHSHENCQALLGSLSEYIDGELPSDLCTEIEKHLEGCENCRVVLNTTRRTIDLVQIPAEGNPLPSEVRERLFKRLDLNEFLNSNH